MASVLLGGPSSLGTTPPVGVGSSRRPTVAFVRPAAPGPTDANNNGTSTELPSSYRTGTSFTGSASRSAYSKSSSQHETQHRLSQQRSIPKSASYVKVEGFNAPGSDSDNNNNTSTATTPKAVAGSPVLGSYDTTAPSSYDSFRGHHNTISGGLLSRQLSTDTLINVPGTHHHSSYFHESTGNIFNGVGTTTSTITEEDMLRKLHLGPVPRPAPLRRSVIPDDILEQHQARHPVFSEPLVTRAFNISRFAHDGRYRRSGEPAFLHCLSVASILADLGADETIIAVALLHDVLDETLLLESQLRPMLCDDATVDLVKQVSQVRHISSKFRASYHATTDSKTPAMATTLVDMLMSMDAGRAQLVALAAALQNMTTLNVLPAHKADALAREALEVWSPLANRLGVWYLKASLEDTAFKHLQPAVFAELRSRLETVQSPTLLVSLVDSLRAGLETASVGHLDLSARPKHFYGVWQKMTSKGYTLDRVKDVRGLRVIVSTKEECYRALRAVEAIWPLAGPTKDYIRHSKENGYQSLHLVARAPDGHEVEVQIRTAKMHFFAEYGSAAAHWQYKESGREKKNGTDISTSPTPTNTSTATSATRGVRWAKFLLAQTLTSGNGKKIDLMASTASMDEDDASPASSGSPGDGHVLGDARFDAYLQKSGQKPAPPPAQTHVAVAVVQSGIVGGGSAPLEVVQLPAGSSIAELVDHCTAGGAAAAASGVHVIVNRKQEDTQSATVLSNGDMIELYHEAAVGGGRRPMTVVVGGVGSSSGGGGVTSSSPLGSKNNMVPLPASVLAKKRSTA